MTISLRGVVQNEGMKLGILALWLVSNAVMFYLSYQKYCAGPQFFYLRQILGESMCISRATAFLLYLNCFLVLLPICKALLTWLRLATQKYIKGAHRRLFNHNHKFHYVIGISIIVLSLIHSLSHCANCYRFYLHHSSDFPELNVSSKKEDIGVLLFLTKLPVYTGVAMLLILAILVIGSLPPVRRSRYEIFWYSHHLSIAFFALLAVHGFGGIVKFQTNMEKHHPGCELMSQNASANGWNCEGRPEFAPDPPQAWKWILAPVILYAVEKVVRFFSARKPVQVTKAIFHSGDVIELRLKKHGFSALPGQFIRLNCPDIAVMQWHPFTLTECPADDDEEFAVHIKIAGDWTGLLAGQLSNMVIVNRFATRVGDSWAISMGELRSDTIAVPVETSVIRLRVDGPYGSPFQDVSRFRVAIVVTAGIGVTPFAAVLNQMRNVFEKSKSYGKLTKLYFIWVCKTHDDLSWFIDILYRTNIKLNLALEQNMMETSLYVTRSKALSQADPSLFDQKRQWLIERVTYRRPNWTDTLQKIDSIHQRERIGVFYCGPKAIHPILHKLCNRTSKSANTFIFHKETF